MAAVNENPVGDSALTTMLEEFEEGTLLSLLDDTELFSYIENYPISATDDLDDVPTDVAVDDDLDLSDLLGSDTLPEFLSSHHNPSHEVVGMSTPKAAVDHSLPDAKCSLSTGEVARGDLQSMIEPHAPSPATSGGSETGVSNSDSDDSDIAEDSVSRPSKRCKVKSCSYEQDRVFLSTCVGHDHCYTHASLSHQQLQLPAVRTEKDAPLTAAEEGSTSDAGYETMSSSTSPGSTARSPPSSTAVETRPLLPPACTTLPPHNTPHLNPVALIDARIKHFMRSQQVSLTEEEEETLKAEGLPIPTTLPLTKVEEKALKSVRRKIRNKVAAQESRKRKKEHMQELEEKVRHCTNQNLRLQKKVESLESENRSLLAQLQKFQALVAGSSNGRHTTKVGACLMMIVLCFAVILGGWAPQKHAYWTSISSDYATSSVRSRSLLSLEATHTTFPQAVCDWFHYTFLPEKHMDNEHAEQSSYHDHSVHTWPDIYLSSYTPLTVHTHNDSHGVVAA